MRKRLTAVVGLVAAVAASITAVWFLERPAGSATKVRTERPVPVQTAVAEQRSIPEVLSVQGFVASEKVVEIRPQVMSSVRAVDIDEGQTVRVGQRMFTLDDRNDAANEPGCETFLQPVQNLRLGGRQTKSQYQYILESVDGGELAPWADKLQRTLAADARFRDVTTDSQLNGLDARVDVDRDRANVYGVELADVRTALFSAFGDRNVSNIYTASDTYDVIMEVGPRFREDETAIGQITVRSKDGRLVPLSNVARITRVAGPTTCSGLQRRV